MTDGNGSNSNLEMLRRDLWILRPVIGTIKVHLNALESGLELGKQEEYADEAAAQMPCECMLAIHPPLFVALNVMAAWGLRPNPESGVDGLLKMSRLCLKYYELLEQSFKQRESEEAGG
jgi:hypothetical protein